MYYLISVRRLIPANDVFTTSPTVIRLVGWDGYLFHVTDIQL